MISAFPKLHFESQVPLKVIFDSDIDLRLFHMTWPRVLGDTALLKSIHGRTKSQGPRGFALELDLSLELVFV